MSDQQFDGYPVIAHTEHDGPVVLVRCETEAAQRQAYRVAMHRLQDGGYADVVAIEMGTEVPEPANPGERETQSGAQLRMEMET